MAANRLIPEGMCYCPACQANESLALEFEAAVADGHVELPKGREGAAGFHLGFRAALKMMAVAKRSPVKVTGAEARAVIEAMEGPYILFKWSMIEEDNVTETTGRKAN